MLLILIIILYNLFILFNIEVQFILSVIRGERWSITVFVVQNIRHKVKLNNLINM